MSEKKTLTEILTELVAFKTVTGDLEAAASCVDYVDKYLSNRNMHVVRHHCNGVPSLVASCQKTKSPKIMLQAHLDVVPGPDPLFRLVNNNGRLTGRGVFDMKFAGAVFLKLVDDLRSEIKNYDFGIMLTFDEEVGGQAGVGDLLKQGYSSKVCVLPDAGDNWQIEVTQKGVWIAQLIARGVAVHGSRPWEGDNAIHRLILATQEIQNLFKDQHAKSDTLSINKILGGSAPNQVADQAEATLDIRFMDESSFKLLNQNIKAITLKHRIDTETVALIYPIKIDMTVPLMQSFLEEAAKIHGTPLRQINSLGNSDAHYFAEHGIPVILLRPDGGSAHSDSEWIDEASLEDYYQLIKAYIQKEARRQQRLSPESF